MNPKCFLKSSGSNFFPLMVYEAREDGGQTVKVAVLFKNTDRSCGRSVSAVTREHKRMQPARKSRFVHIYKDRNSSAINSTHASKHVPYVLVRIIGSKFVLFRDCILSTDAGSLLHVYILADLMTTPL